MAVSDEGTVACRGGVIIDFDNTMLSAERFYEEVYARAVEEVIVEAHGGWGKKMLRRHRENTGHMGILTLPFFGVPFSRFAEKLDGCSLDDIPDQTQMAEELRRLPLPKVIFSGSPRSFIMRVLRHWGLEESVFREIVAWNPGEDIPLKHCASALVFKTIADRHGWSPPQSWSLGDSWNSDLRPALATGMRTIGVGPCKGRQDLWFPTLEEALLHLHSFLREKRFSSV